MSPAWLVLAAPALVLPLGLAFLFDDAAPPSMVEQAVSALPIPGDASEPGQAGPAARIALFGAPGASLPPSVSAALYNNSARADAARLAPRSEKPDAAQDILADSYALMHPRSLAGEDMLAGDLALLFANPTPDPSWAVLGAYCASAPETESARVSLAELPINAHVSAAIRNFLPASEYGAFCPRLAVPQPPSP